jgi:hypothetical protein
MYLQNNGAGSDNKKTLTWIARLANFPSLPVKPVKIAAFLADPVTRLVFDRTFVSCIENRGVLRMP